jgi:iron(III) transport system substrate-binding protein
MMRKSRIFLRLTELLNKPNKGEKMNKLLFALLATMLVASLALACAAPAPGPLPTPGPSPAPSPGETDIRAQIIAKAKEEGELVIVGVGADFYGERFKSFIAKYPFIKIKGLKLSPTKTANRIVSEVQAGRTTVDVFTSPEDAAFTLAQVGALQEPLAPYPLLKDFPKIFQPASGLFAAAFLNPKAQMAYNPETVAPEELPSSWDEMSDPRWKGKVLISSNSDEMPGRLAWLWRKDVELDWDRSFEFFRKIWAQKPLITSGSRIGAEQVAAGEKAIYWLPSHGGVTQQHFGGHH